MTRQLRRRLDRLCVENEPVIDADRKFFERFPHRRHRLRPASAAEVSTLGVLSPTGRVETLPNWARWFTAVKRVEGVGHLRVFLIGTAVCESDTSEAVAARVFDETWRNTGAPVPADGEPL